MLDPDQVKARPGFAAFIDTQNLAGETHAVIICIDPEAWGYTRTARTSYVPDNQQADREEEARQAAQRRLALVTASSVRHAFLEQTYSNARLAKKVYLDALRDAVEDPETIRVVTTHENLAVKLAGADFTEAPTAGIDRLTRMLVARWITAAEANLDSCIHHRWNNRPQAAQNYFDRLTAAGYTLSDAEQEFYDEMAAKSPNARTRTTRTRTNRPPTRAGILTTRTPTTRMRTATPPKALSAISRPMPSRPRRSTLPPI